MNEEESKRKVEEGHYERRSSRYTRITGTDGYVTAKRRKNDDIVISTHLRWI